MSNMLLNKKETLILEEFSDDYHKGIHGRAISKKTNLNQKTVSNILNKLEKANIVKFKFEGKNKIYFLNEFNAHIKEIIKIIEIHKKLKFLEHNKKFTKLFEKLEESTDGIAVIFGSFASLSQTSKSDLDILIIGKSQNIENVEKAFNIQINPLITSKKKFDKNTLVAKEIIKNHIILKGVDEFVNLLW